MLTEKVKFLSFEKTMNISSTRHYLSLIFFFMMILTACLSFNLRTCLAAPYAGDVFILTQPDGSKVEVKVWGDEFYQRVESLDGYTLIRDKATGWICYAELAADQSDFVSTGIIYKDSPSQRERAKKSLASKNMKKHLKLPRNIILEKRGNKHKELNRGISPDAGDVPAAMAPSISPLSAPLTGAVLGLTLLIDFPDEPSSITQAEIDNYCNQWGYNNYGCNGSVRDYYHDVSGGLLDYTNHVTAFYTAANNKAYYTDSNISYGTRARELIHEALDHLENVVGFDFSTLSTDASNCIRAINAFYAGFPDSGWAQGLWPHKGYLSPVFNADGVQSRYYQITDIGNNLDLRTFCHENGHMLFSWPDLYDYGYDSMGIGNYGLMAYGGSNDNPVPPCAHFRDNAGWETIIDITDEPLCSIFTHIANSLSSYRYSHPTDSNEYFLIESRTQTGRNTSLPDEGLMIWHIDENGSNNNQQMTCAQHYRVSLEQADGLFQLENDNNAGGAGDLFHDGDNNEFSDTTDPNAAWWCSGQSGLVVRDISAVGAQMTFTFGLLEGYVYDNTVPFHFEDISGTGTNLYLSDDDWEYISLPFSFTFYSQEYDAVSIGSNGKIYFEDRDHSYNNRCIPVNSNVDTFIAPFWDDLNPSRGGAVYYEIRGTAPTRRLIVQWHQVPRYYNYGAATFQAILFENGNRILFQYEDVDFGYSSYNYGASATVGLQENTINGIQYSCNAASLSNGLAIEFLNLGVTVNQSAYSFSEGEETFTRDDSGNGNNGTIHGATWTDGKIGNGLSFDGINDWVGVINNPLLNPTEQITVEAWVKFDDLTDGGIIGKYDNHSYYSYCLWFEGGTLYFEIGSRDYLYESKLSYSGLYSGTWYQIVGTYDRQNVKLYVNAQNVDTEPETIPMGLGGSPLCIGTVRYNGINTHSYNETDEYFKGIIDEVRIYNYALSEEEVKNRYLQVQKLLIPKTGQTMSYYLGDDGDLQIGIEWPEPRFFDNGNGTITDKLTGLIWFEDASVTGSTTWDYARNYCNNSTFAGFTDWRLPNTLEMFSLFCADNYQPPIPSDHLFYDFKAGLTGGTEIRYWVSNSYYRNGSWSGYRCFFTSTDFVWDDDPKNGVYGREFYFIPVRGESGNGIYNVPKTGKVDSYATGDDGDLEKGAEWPEPRFTDNGDGTVTDNMTNLMWVKDAWLAGESKTWVGALDFCNNLEYAGFDDWHLPNVYELSSIFDFEYYAPNPEALPTGHPFINTNHNNYWTSTSRDANSAYIFIKFIQVSLDYGRIPMLRVYDKSESRSVWPVRIAK